jgi:light-regulated signal transduction histidine kinase (bacteriophytochrome)
MADMPLSKIIGLPFDEFVVPENKAEYKQLFEKCWREDCKGEVMLMSKTHRTPVQLSLTTLELEEGVSLSIILTDLTTQKETQEQLSWNNKKLEEINKELEASNHDLQQFASVASHDLQEPIRKIQIFSNMLKARQTELTPDSKKYLEKIIDSSVRMKALIVDILSYSALSAGYDHVDCIDLNDMLLELKEDFELTIQEKNAKIISGVLPCIDVNKGQIRQVFQNIISNALKFTKPGEPPIVEITSKTIKEKSFDSVEDEQGDYCLISVKDGGIGFDEKYVGNIFALFARLNSKDKYEGTGIGMAIAKKIIEKHNGMITATSKEGEGSTFKIILPIKQEQTQTGK